MRRISLKFFLGFVVGCLSLGLSGCISIPNSPMPRFYALSALDRTEVIKDSPKMIIGIGPVKIPEYMDRPQIVTEDKDKMLHFAQFDRWGESLDLGLARLIREDLTVMFPGTKLTLYPWNPSIDVKYQVLIEVVQLDNEFDRDMSFVVQWTVIDLQSSKIVIIKRSEFHQPIVPPNYSGLAKTLSTACASLSNQIAEELSLLEK